MIELLFMNINHPGQASNPKARRLVRSHITRRQHNQKRSASVQALGSEPARTRTNGRGDDASKSQYDGLSPSPSTRTICPSARTSSYKAESTTTAEHLAARESGSPRRKLGYLSKPYDAACTLPSDSLEDSRAFRHSHLGDTTELLIHHEQRVPIPSRSQSVEKCSTMLGLRRGSEGKAFSSLEGAIEEHAERASQRVCCLTSRLKCWSSSGLVSHVTKYVPASRIHCSRDDLDEELRAFAETLGISITAMLDHFYEVVDVVAATSEPKPGLTQKYMVALWDTGMRVDPAARAAIMFSAAAKLRLNQTNPFHPIFLYMLRSYALSCIRIALDDPKTYASDAVLVAVSTIAQTESVCGWLEDHEVHSQGLALIMKARDPAVAQALDALLSITDSITLPQILEWGNIAYSDRMQNT